MALKLPSVLTACTDAEKAAVLSALLHALGCAEERSDRTDDCLLRESARDFPAEATCQIRHTLETIAEAADATGS